MASSDGQIVADDGVRLFFERAGEDGRPLVVLNGFYLLGDFRWLAESRTVIGLDLRNRGRSDWVRDPSKLGRGVRQDVDDIEAMRRQLGIEQLDLLAHSYAGLVAVLYAVRHPTRVGRIILIGPMQPDSDVQYPAELTNQDEALQEFVAAAGQLQERREAYAPEAFCRETWALLRRLYVFDPEDAGKLGHWEECRLPTELHFMPYWTETLLPSIQTLEFPPAEIAAVTMPVLVVHGTKDRSAPYGGGRDWAGLLPNARLLTVENVAHAPWIEAPGEVLGPIRTFLEGAWPEGAEEVEPS